MEPTPVNSSTRYRIADLVLDTGSRRVTRGSELLKVNGLTFDLLLILIESAPNIVTFDEVAERVWHGRHVTPETIAQRAKMLRDALSDDASEPRYVESIRGQGYRLIADVEIIKTETARTLSNRKLPLLAATVFVIAALLLIGTSLIDKETTPSVAVLPFTDMTQDGDHQYLADGVAEELIDELTELSGLHVVSRVSSFKFRESADSLRTIGKALGVTSVLQGSVRKSEDDIRIAVQLVDVMSGDNLWSETFDSDHQDIFAVQEQIAASVAGALGVKLGVGSVNDFKGAGTRNFAAYEAFLQGNYELAIQLDPNYAAAWALQGVKIVSAMWLNPPEQAPEIIERAYPYLLRGLELDPGSSRAQGQFATFIYAKMEWIQAEESRAKALSMRRDRRNLTGYALMLMRAGRLRKAHAIFDEAESLERMPSRPRRIIASLHIGLGEFEAARDIASTLQGRLRLDANVLVALNDGTLDDLRAALEAMPDTEPVKAELYTPLLDVLTSPEQALAVLKAVFADKDNMWPDKYHDIALLAAYFGDPEFALEVFSHEIPYTTIRFGALWYPVMSDVRQLPRFRQLVTDINLVGYWQAYGWADYCRPLGDAEFVCH
jgi:TolB-like protein